MVVTDVTMIGYRRYSDVSMLRIILSMSRFLSTDCTGCDGNSNGDGSSCDGDSVTVVTNDVFDLRTLLLTCKSL